MLELDVMFCPECMDKIINPKLRQFWQQLCVYSIIQKSWFPFSEKDRQSLRWLGILEDKKLLITTEDSECIYAKPLEVYITEDEGFIICSEDDSHLGKSTLRRIWWT